MHFTFMYVNCNTSWSECCVMCVCRMATKLLKLAADEKREARKDGLPPSGVHILNECTAFNLHVPLQILSFPTTFMAFCFLVCVVAHVKELEEEVQDLISKVRDLEKTNTSLQNKVPLHTIYIIYM